MIKGSNISVYNEFKGTHNIVKVIDKNTDSPRLPYNIVWVSVVIVLIIDYIESSNYD
jgi:hypothetical protein